MVRNAGGDSTAEGIGGHRDVPSGWRRRFALPFLALIVSLFVIAPVASALPDGRAYEQVSPSNKHGASVQPLGFGFQGPDGGIVQSSEDGERFTYVSDLPVESEPEGNRAFEGNQTLAQRSPGGWSNRDIVTPHHRGEGLAPGTPNEYRLFSPDLGIAALQPYGLLTKFMEPPLVAGVPSEERSLYRRNNQVCETTSVGCYEAIVNPGNVTGTTEGKPSQYGGQLELLAGTPDLNHSLFISQVPLTSPSSTEEPVGIYESDNTKPAAEQLQLVSVLPGPEAKPAVEAALGNIEASNGENGKPLRNVVSNDGSRVFWNGLDTLTNKKGEELTFHYSFMRDTVKKVTIRLDAAEEGVKEVLNEKEAEDRRSHFQAASTDGSKIFFTSNASLTSDAKVKPKEFGGGPVELYVCEIPTTTEITESTKCKLHSLTGGFKGPGDVVGMVSAVSEDGNYVYFVANGVPEGGTKGNCPNPTSEGSFSPTEHCNVYVAHFNGTSWEAPKLIAIISGNDAPDFAFGGLELGQLTARTSPHGQYFAFMSEKPLTGYDNRDLNPLAKEARDEEVFLYNAANEHLTCVSCNSNPSQRPTGVLDQIAAGEGFGLTVDPFSHVWENRWISGSIPAWTSIDAHQAPYQARYLLDNGRLYFTSTDALVPHAKEKRVETIEGTTPENEPSKEVGIENVYQYEPGGLGSCEASKEACVSLISSGTSEHESGFLDASTTGNNVFFITAEKLVSSDLDTTFDAYDARECTPSSPCITPPPPPGEACNSESTCRSGGSGGGQNFGSAPSSTYNGPGNIPKTEVLGLQVVKPPKKLTNAQKLAKALAACRKKYKHSHSKRARCERQARHAYAKKASKHKKGKK